MKIKKKSVDTGKLKLKWKMSASAERVQRLMFQVEDILSRTHEVADEELISYNINPVSLSSDTVWPVGNSSIFCCYLTFQSNTCTWLMGIGCPITISMDKVTNC